MSEIKPIETRYKGYRFRSRLEARWAVFFDALGLKWEYEIQGFDLGPELGLYLPDFYLPETDEYIEVKPERIVKDHTEEIGIYLAGKMSEGHDYRGLLVRDNRLFAQDPVAFNRTWRTNEMRIAGDYGRPNGPKLDIGHHITMYLGPFTTSCDHGCAHRGQHKAANCMLYGREEGVELLHHCKSGVATCDIFFVHFETPDQFGTLVELGWASAFGKLIWMTMGTSVASELAYPELDSTDYFGTHDLWFSEFCSKRFAVTDDPMTQLKEWLDQQYPFSREQQIAHKMLEDGIVLSVAYGDPLCEDYYHTWPIFSLSCTKTDYKSAAITARSARFEHGECG